MSKYRNNLPQLNGKMFLTDGGLETTLIFHHGMDLPHFAAFPMLNDPLESEILKSYFLDYLQIAKKNQLGFVLESPTFRSNPDWGYKLGYDLEQLKNVNQLAIQQLIELRDEFEDEHTPMVISGCLGPRGDGYVVSDEMNVEEAKEYHNFQIKAFKDAGADIISAFTLNYINEALGIVLSARENDMPVVISFTVETDGNLPSGMTLKEAIESIDSSTESYPVYYMINCAHPTHFKNQLQSGDSWLQRIMAIRANASTKSHAELDDSEQLDAGDKHDLARKHIELKKYLPNLKVIGGCCGTDHSHIEEICSHLIPQE